MEAWVLTLAEGKQLVAEKDPEQAAKEQKKRDAAMQWKQKEMIGNSNNAIRPLMHLLQVLSFWKASLICRKLQAHFPWLRKAERKYQYAESILFLTHIPTSTIVTGLGGFPIGFMSDESTQTWTVQPRSQPLTIHYTSHSLPMLQTCQLLVQVLVLHMEFSLLSNQINPNSLFTTCKCEIIITILRSLCYCWTQDDNRL